MTKRSAIHAWYAVKIEGSTFPVGTAPVNTVSELEKRWHLADQVFPRKEKWIENVSADGIRFSNPTEVRKEIIVELMSGAHSVEKNRDDIVSAIAVAAVQDGDPGFLSMCAAAAIGHCFVEGFIVYFSQEDCRNSVNLVDYVREESRKVIGDALLLWCRIRDEASTQQNINIIARSLEKAIKALPETSRNAEPESTVN